MAWLFKVLAVLAVGPLLVCLALQLVVGVLTAVLPWLLLGSLVAGVAAGLSAGLVLRRRLPPANGRAPVLPGSPLLGSHRVRRPKGRVGG
jgi:hypothetical protein